MFVMADVLVREEIIKKLPDWSAVRSLAVSCMFRSGKCAKKLCGFWVDAKATPTVRQARRSPTIFFMVKGLRDAQLQIITRQRVHEACKDIRVTVREGPR